MTIGRAAVLALLVGACGDDGGAASVDAPPAGADAADADDLLSTWALFTDGPAQTPAADVVPFEVISPLYADEALKLRFLRVPAGATIGYDPVARWDFPVGTVLVKTFAYPDDARVVDGPRRLLETRLLVHDDDGWTPHVFVWDDAQTEATRRIAGETLDVAWTDATGAARTLDYRVPNTNQCLQCHGARGDTHPLGPRTRQLDRDGQLEELDARGLLAPSPPPPAERVHLTDPADEAAPLDDRARAYLEGNCAHCHNATAAAQSTGLRLELETTTPIDLGVCRSPFSAGPGTGGRAFDIVPGHPEQSILIFRVSSTEPELKMPEGPTRTSDAFGVTLLTQWIDAMTPEGCTL